MYLDSRNICVFIQSFLDNSLALSDSCQNTPMDTPWLFNFDLFSLPSYSILERLELGSEQSRPEEKSNSHIASDRCSSSLVATIQILLL